MIRQSRAICGARGTQTVPARGVALKHGLLTMSIATGVLVDYFPIITLVSIQSLEFGRPEGRFFISELHQQIGSKWQECSLPIHSCRQR